MLLDAISFFVSALFLFGIRKAETLPERAEGADAAEHARRRARRAQLRHP